MLKISKFPDLGLDLPSNTSYWKGVASSARRLMRKRTITGKKDVKGKPFKKYSDAYREYRKSKGRGVVPNLLFTGRMLGAIQAVGKRLKGQLLLSGEEGLKAHANEARGREFFDLADGERDSIFKKVSGWITNKNGLTSGR